MWQRKQGCQPPELSAAGELPLTQLLALSQTRAQETGSPAGHLPPAPASRSLALPLVAQHAAPGQQAVEQHMEGAAGNGHVAPNGGLARAGAPAAAPGPLLHLRLGYSAQRCAAPAAAAAGPVSVSGQQAEDGCGWCPVIEQPQGAGRAWGAAEAAGPDLGLHSPCEEAQGADWDMSGRQDSGEPFIDLGRCR